MEVRPLRAILIACVFIAVQPVVIGSNDETVQLADTLMAHLAYSAYRLVLSYLFYMAVEPYVRRLWPDSLIAWSRLLDGRLRDPLLGKHILIGALVGIGVADTMPPLLKTNPRQEETHTVPVNLPISRSRLARPSVNSISVSSAGWSAGRSAYPPKARR